MWADPLTAVACDFSSHPGLCEAPTANWSNVSVWGVYNPQTGRISPTGDDSGLPLFYPNNGAFGQNHYSVSISAINSQITLDVDGITVDNISVFNGSTLNTVSGTHTVINNGISQVADFANLQNAGVLDNGFDLPLGSSTLVNNSGFIVNTATGTIFNDSVIDNLYGPLTNNGVLLNSSGSTQFQPIRSVLNNYSPIDPFLGGGFTNNATLNNAGTVNNIYGGYTDPFGEPMPAIISNNGTLNNGLLANIGGVLTNLPGTLNNGSGTILNNNASGTISNNVDSVLNNAGTLNNSGILNNHDGATLSNSGTLNNSGAISNTGTINNAGLLSNSGTFVNDGTLNNSGTVINTGMLTASRNLNNDGFLENTGSGTLSNVGSLNIGASATLQNDVHATLNNGALTNSAFLINNGMLSNLGTLNNSAFLINYGTLMNTGILNNSGSNLSFPATIQDYGALINRGTLNNAGVINVYSGGSIQDVGTFNNSGTVTTGTDLNGFVVLQGGVLDNSSTGTLAVNVLDVAGNLENDGNIFMTASYPLVIESTGTLSGNGTIVGNIVNNGRVSPGHSPGVLTVDGNYTQTATGIYLLELGGPLPGEYDLLIVSLTAMLGGTLDIELMNGFVPAGQSFPFLVAGNVIGDFSNVAFLNCGNCSFSLLNDGRDISLVANAMPEPSTFVIMSISIVWIFIRVHRTRTPVASRCRRMAVQ